MPCPSQTSGVNVPNYVSVYGIGAGETSPRIPRRLSDIRLRIRKTPLRKQLGNQPSWNGTHARAQLRIIQREYRRVFNHGAPTAKSIKKWHDTFLATGSVLKKHGGGRRTSDEMVANVQAAYERSPRKSLRRASRELQVPKSTLQRHPKWTRALEPTNPAGPQAGAAGRDFLVRFVESSSTGSELGLAGLPTV
ncbi:hypothetical protein ANN_12776 [Periplaneta americana]|uniref:DUF4817 domain-containing protein n=1 Tax=Periplaneta americana TaxID=6978 RepID=A0ABQ8TI25_PERAM|nr:hypothetical protein ANN_12776 [Periplaneta americana]